MTNLHDRPSAPVSGRWHVPLAIALAIMAVIVLGAAVGFGGSTGQSAVLPVEELVGAWDVTSEAHTTRIALLEDGTYTMYADDRKEGLRVDWGTYGFDSDLIVFHSEGGRGCEGASGQRIGSDGSYTPTFDGPNSATLSVVDDECGKRASDLDDVYLVRNAS